MRQVPRQVLGYLEATVIHSLQSVGLGLREESSLFHLASHFTPVTLPVSVWGGTVPASSISGGSREAGKRRCLVPLVRCIAWSRSESAAGRWKPGKAENGEFMFNGYEACFAR